MKNFPAPHTPAFTADYRRMLREELEVRTERNPGYSVRAFAKALAIESSALSQILSGKRDISVRVMERLLSGLELSESDRSRFIESVAAEKRARGTRNVNRALRPEALPSPPPADGVGSPKEGVGLDAFRLISGWHHYAILEMTFKEDFREDARWIAKRLGITTLEAKLAFERLISLELLERVNGKWRKTFARIDTKDQTKTSGSHRTRQMQILEKARYSLENDPIDERNHTAITICADPARIAAAKEKIRKFLWEISAFLEEGTPSRVYEISLQLFPLERNVP